MDSKNIARANLKKYIKVDGRWRFVPVLIDGTPVRSTTGTFYLEYYEDGRRVQRPVGTTPREAKDAWYRQSNPERESEPPLTAEDLRADLITVSVAFQRFLDEVKATKEPATFDAYRADLNWVERRLGQKLVSQVTRHEILRVMGKGRDEGLNTNTVNRKLIVALMALRNVGAKIVMKKGDWPKVTEPMVEIYEPKQMTAFFGSCAPKERLLFETFLCTGFRAREIATLTWEDVDSQQRTLNVRRKPAYGFKPKNHEERTVLVPLKLINSLNKYKKTHGDERLLFPTPPHPRRPGYGGNKPDAHHLELCKLIAWRAKLNCRRCTTTKGKCASGPHCKRWTLHKWRHTFATNALRSGVDVKTLQVMLGHKNLTTTEKYLKSLPAPGLRNKIEKWTIAAILRGK